MTPLVSLNSLRMIKHIVGYGEARQPFHFTIFRKEDGYYTALTFGKEAEDSPMAGGVSYGAGDTLEEALQGNMKELRLE